MRKIAEGAIYISPIVSQRHLSKFFQNKKGFFRVFLKLELLVASQQF
jgi:hypothetical protein